MRRDDEEETEESSRRRRHATAESPWVLVNTRRPEVDIPASEGAPRAPYHYDGTGGIELSSWIHRAAVRARLGSKELLLSDDITSESRILLHRDVHDRLQTLAPFIQWDSHAVPLTADGRIVFVVDGYTTSENYPYAERVDLGGARVNYARASVRATVDAFSGQVDVYLTDESEPHRTRLGGDLPDAVPAEEEMPAELRNRLRYPADLFAAQATAYETVPHHPARPVRERCRRVVATDRSVRAARGRGRRRLRRVGRGRSPAHHASRRTRSRLRPGRRGRGSCSQTYYTPRRGQNLVATLSGWIDEHGAPDWPLEAFRATRSPWGPLRSAGWSSRHRA